MKIGYLRELGDHNRVPGGSVASNERRPGLVIEIASRGKTAVYEQEGYPIPAVT